MNIVCLGSIFYIHSAYISIIGGHFSACEKQNAGRNQTQQSTVHEPDAASTRRLLVMVENNNNCMAQIKLCL